MKFLIYSDNHFCERSSIITKQGNKYSVRLENQLQSLNWVERLAEKENCEGIICAGDFFDKPFLTDQELTALKEIKWAKCQHYFLVGNHDSSENDLHFSSTKALEGKNRQVISEPTCLDIDNFELAFLPYFSESAKRPLSELLPKLADKPRLLISHEDLIGIQLGPVISRVGFKPKELEEFATLIINGHLHNGQQITEKIINIGDLTGQTFGEDAFKYKHQVILFDSNNFSIKYIENPYAFNFYKLEIDSGEDLKKINTLKNNAVVAFQCKATLYQKLTEYLKTCENIVSTRIILKQEATDSVKVDITDLVVDHFAKFAECCRSKLENTKILEEELTEILK